MQKGNELQVITTMNEMCIESLPPDAYEQWENVKTILFDTRSALKPHRQDSPVANTMNTTDPNLSAATASQPAQEAVQEQATETVNEQVAEGQTEDLAAGEEREQDGGEGDTTQG